MTRHQQASLLSSKTNDHLEVHIQWITCLMIYKIVFNLYCFWLALPIPIFPMDLEFPIFPMVKVYLWLAFNFLFFLFFYLNIDFFWRFWMPQFSTYQYSPISVKISWCLFLMYPGVGVGSVVECFGKGISSCLKMHRKANQK